jgi:hypothetical protein
VLNYDRRLAPSHPDPPVPEYRSLEFLRKNLHEAICHKEDHFKMVWAMDVLQRKIEEELAGQDFRLSDSVCGVIHVLLFKPKTHTALKVGSSFCPGVFKSASRLRQYKICFAPLEMKKVEAIHLYQSTRKAGLVEQRLHQKLRTQHGNVHPHDLKSKDLYATERLQAILDWISCARSSSSQSTLLFRANDPTRKNKRERK